MSKENKNQIQILSENLFPVVGVGASAGGLESFKELIKAIPEDSGMAYILIQHLAPQYESMLSEILQKLTQIPVLEIVDNIKVLPDHIYIIPSNKLLTANDGVLQLDPRIKGEKINTIDMFFTSLAETHQEQAIGIILSGTGSDGTVGLKVIKNLGGITMAQDEDSAAYYGMPQSAIDAEVVDFVLPPREIPKYLQQLVKEFKTGPSDFTASEEIKEDEVFKQILSLLRIKRGVDFSYYKQTTIRRRILRRKALNKIEKLKDYQNYLLENKAEQDALFKDVLIPVTAFFRDPNIFTDLYETFFPNLFKNKPATEHIRIWVAGCSTGEEPYSIAILLHEYFGEEVTSKKIQIFATDISETVIAKARSGIYEKKDIAGVSEQRIKKFFTKINGNYHINKIIRQMCIFACQNFLKDPPFANVDLISCRNVLIYMSPYLQKKALNTFHYALNHTGFLLLGKSENIGQSSEEFHTLSKPDKIYTRKAGTGKYMLVATESSEAALKRKDDSIKNKEGGKDDFQKAANDALLSKYATVGVIVNEQLDILQFRGKTSAYLEAPHGKASHNILKMAVEGLSFELRNALHKAQISNDVVKKEAIPLDKGNRKVTIEVIPLHNTIELYFLVLFSDAIEPALKTQKTKKKLNKDEEAKLNIELARIEQLEKELIQTREDMRTITEDQEAANEELQSANEELLSGGEELQSLNEELETTKEEIQSSNEELTVLNQELIERNEQLVNSRQYAEAIITTIHEPLIVLNKELRIRSANNAFYQKFFVNEQQTHDKLFFEIDNERWNIAGIRERLQKILPNSSYFENFEVKITLSSGTEGIIVLNARNIIGEPNNEQLILLALHDVTDQKLFEHKLEQEVFERTKELKETNLHLEQTNENLQQFASIASHDLQEPLRKIKTFTGVLNKKFSDQLPAEGKEVINKIIVAVNRMSALIKDVLQFSKLANAAKEFVQTDLNSILLNVMSDLDLLISETKTLINYKETLPTVDAIPLQINQLFYNLFTNALKFHNSSSQAVISIDFKNLSAEDVKKYFDNSESHSYIEIIFSDNGIGFEQQFADQIFQLFERLHSFDEFEGTGVGLALCKKIVENHNGFIFALSKENQGSSFHIILPSKQ